jgi:hypothetical protein
MIFMLCVIESACECAQTRRLRDECYITVKATARQGIGLACARQRRFKREKSSLCHICL